MLPDVKLAKLDEKLTLELGKQLEKGRQIDPFSRGQGGGGKVQGPWEWRRNFGCVCSSSARCSRAEECEVECTWSSETKDGAYSAFPWIPSSQP